MWIYKLGAYSEGNDIHVLFHFNDTLYSVNITHIDIEKCYNSVIATPLQEVLTAINKKGNSVSDELLKKKEDIAVWRLLFIQNQKERYAAIIP